MPIDNDGHAADIVHEVFREAERFRAEEYAVLLPRDGALVRTAKPRRGLDQCVQYRRQIEGGAADNLEHLGSRRLLLERFGQIVGALLHFAKEPHILDGDGGLIGKGFDQGNLPIREWFHLEVIDHHDAEQFVTLEDRNTEDGPDRLHVFRAKRIFGVGPNIMNMDGPTLETRATRSALIAKSHWILRYPPFKIRRRVVGGRQTQKFSIKPVDEGSVRFAERSEERRVG